MIVGGFIFSLLAFTAISTATAKSPGITATKSPFESGRGPRDADDAVADHDPPQCLDDLAVSCRDGNGFVCLEEACDGIEHCPDGSDERDCDKEDAPSALDCGWDIVVTCVGGAREICPHQVCDGRVDCLNGSDELECGYALPNCSGDSQFKCADGFGIFCRDQLCDGVIDCHDGSDEHDCVASSSHTPARTSLTAGADKQCPDDAIYRCTDGRGQVCADQECDETLDCIFPSDEIKCGDLAPTPSSTQHNWCPGDSSVCADGSAVCAEQVCDGFQDCADGSDELNCGPLSYSESSTTASVDSTAASSSCASGIVSTIMTSLLITSVLVFLS